MGTNQIQNRELPKVIDKKCPCGVHWVTLPNNARSQNSGDCFSGIYFECQCGSTLVILDSKFKKKGAA